MTRSTVQQGPHPVDRYVGRRVYEKRLALGYNQSDLGRAIGLTFQQVQKYEKGANRISASTLWSIADFLKVEVGYFFDGVADNVSTPAGPCPPGKPATPASLQISTLAPRLSTKQQRAVLEMFRAMVETDWAR